MTRLPILIALLLNTTPVMATDITGVPRILDGDTVQIGEIKIRLAGIDAPETHPISSASIPQERSGIAG
jgi:endonuclease YncB( thermonuclease family)